VVEELGSEMHALFPVDAPAVTAESLDVAPTEASLLLEAQSRFTARLDARTTARAGTPLVVAIDPDRFHFFDPETGENLLTAAALQAEPAPELPELAAR
jgi:multiple sugar transport system ATP-binding protein